MDNLENLKRTIDGARHEDYERTLERARFYKQIVTGESQDYLVVSYAPRETPEQKKQRIALYHTRTKDVSARISSQFEKVGTVETVSAIENERGETPAELSRFVSRFSGETLKKWINKKALYYNFIDPNSFEALLYNEAQADLYPVIFSAENSLNFKIKNGRPEWFVGCVYVTIVKDKQKIKLCDYTLLAAGEELFAFEIPEGGRIIPGYQETEPLETYEANNKTYYIYRNQTTTKETPARRWGYLDDTNNAGKTFVSILDSAEFQLRDLINRKSEEDLSLALHSFPQKMQIAESCQYTRGNDVCNGGTLSLSGKICPACKGSGKKTISSVQDVMLVKPPSDQEEKEYFIPLTDRVKYIEMPFDIVKHQGEKVEKLPKDISVSIFGVDIEERPKGGSTTATAINNYNDSINQVLSKYADSVSDMWAFNVRLAAQYLGIEEVRASLKYPGDFELMSAADWTAMLKANKEAGAGADVLAFINAQIIKKLTNEDGDAVKRSMLIYKLRPFVGVPDEILKTHLNLLPNNSIDKFIYLNIERILNELLTDSPDLLDSSFPIINKLVREKAAALVLEEFGSASFRDNL